MSRAFLGAFPIPTRELSSRDSQDQRRPKAFHRCPFTLCTMVMHIPDNWVCQHRPDAYPPSRAPGLSQLSSELDSCYRAALSLHLSIARLMKLCPHGLPSCDQPRLSLRRSSSPTYYGVQATPESSLFSAPVLTLPGASSASLLPSRSATYTRPDDLSTPCRFVYNLFTTKRAS